MPPVRAATPPAWRPGLGQPPRCLVRRRGLGDRAAREWRGFRRRQAVDLSRSPLCFLHVSAPRVAGSRQRPADWPEVVELWRRGVCGMGREQQGSEADGEKMKSLLIRAAEEGPATIENEHHLSEDRDFLKICCACV